MSISIGIPFYNAEKFLPDAIRSVFAQTCQDWELILCDDGSTDRSLEITKSVKDNRVRVLSDGCNRQLPSRLNQIISESKFEIVARMDADDIMTPLRLEKQLTFFNNPKTQMVSSAYCTINDNNELMTVRNLDGKPDISAGGVLNHRHLICHPAVIARKLWFERNKYDSYYYGTEDIECWFRACINGELTNENFVLYPKPLLFYRESPATQTYQKTSKRFKYQNEIIKKYSPYVPVKDRIIGRAKWFLRNNAYAVAAKLGVLPYFKQIREKKITDTLLYNELKSQLDIVLSTRVPGMDDYLENNLYNR